MRRLVEELHTSRVMPNRKTVCNNLYSYSPQVKDAVKGGQRPEEVPTCTPIEIKELMIECWHGNPDMRPEFKTITRKLEIIADKKRIELKDRRRPSVLSETAPGRKRARSSESKYSEGQEREKYYGTQNV